MSEIAQTKRGEASERILHALAAEFPKLHSRQSLIDSRSLRARMGKAEDEGLSDKEQRAVAKTLGRLIGDNSISEVICLRGQDEKVLLPAAGLIAVSVDLGSLRKAWSEWREREEAWQVDHAQWTQNRSGSEPQRPREPTQNAMVQEIIDASTDWVQRNIVEGKLPLSLTNVSVIHGSNAFDILITASYRDAHKFLQYTQEVVQRIEHVEGTHTMQIARSYGFPDVTGFD